MLFIVNTQTLAIVPWPYPDFEQAQSQCEPGEKVYIADSLEQLEETLEAELMAEERTGDI